MGARARTAIEAARARWRCWMCAAAFLVLALIAGRASARLAWRHVRVPARDFVNLHTPLFHVTPADLDAYVHRYGIPPGMRSNQTVLDAGPLRVSRRNPRYFEDGRGRIVYLAGSHTWLNLQDGGLVGPPPAFDFERFLDVLAASNHNFFRLWRWEQGKWLIEWPSPFFISPQPYPRSGAGAALDGRPRYDVSRFDQAYFDRLRQRVQAGGARGMYVSVMLFNGWSVDWRKGPPLRANPWDGHPFNAANNANGVDGDPDQDGNGRNSHSLAVPRVVALQEAYVAKVIDAVNDLDNVLYEISNESTGGSAPWQYHMVEFVRRYEAGKPKQHPVGMTAEWPNGDNCDLFRGPADWVSPNSYKDPPPADGRKVIVSDTDHLWGIGGNRAWVWMSFLRGANPAFMDQYDDSYKLEGGGYRMTNENDVSIRQSLGYTRWFAGRIDLARMTPQPERCGGGYCLASSDPLRPEYLVYFPDGRGAVDLSATGGGLHGEWFDSASGRLVVIGRVEGGVRRTFTSPFGRDAVLHLGPAGTR